MTNKSKRNNDRCLIKLISEWGFTWVGLHNNINGEWWLASQLSIITIQLYLFGFAIIKTNYNIQIINIIICIGSLLMGTIYAIKSFLDLGKSLSPLPEPKPGAELIISGSYKKCRHPLYRSLIYLSIGIVFYCWNLANLILLILLCIILIGKAKREERKLKLIHPYYTKYIEITPAIIARIPFLDWRN
tara:strand:+ start:641 stop:1204 length:564 start_codon:yes stop_codon:yes gene_type:complete